MDIEQPYIIMFIFTALTNIILLLRNRRSIRKGNVIWSSILFIVVACNYLYVSNNHYPIFPFDLLDDTITLIVFLVALLWPLVGLAVFLRIRGVIIYIIIHTFILTVPSMYFDSLPGDMFVWFFIYLIGQPIFIGIVLFDFVGLTLINIGAALIPD